MKPFDYDLIVIGGGAAGMVASKLARGLGKRAAIVEKRKMGGECTNYGCVPSKALIRIAKAAHQSRHLQDYGLGSETSLSLKTDNVMPHVRSIVDKVNNEHPAEKFREEGVDVIFGNPQFQDNHTITLEGKPVTARSFIIATGSTAFVPPIEGVKTVPYLTNESVFGIDRLPQSMIVLGGGPIGIELAAALGRLGVEITVVEMLERILFREDKELVDMLTPRLEFDGLKLLTSTKAMKFSQANGKVVLTIQRGNQTRDIQAESTLIAIGRKPNIEGLGLDKAGVAYTNKGIVADERLKTTAPNIYACGDVVGPYQFSHMAEYQAVIACTNTFLPFKKKVDYGHLVWTTFTDPELAHAGLTEEEARKQYGNNISVYRYNYKNMDRAITEGEDFGMSKIICNKRGRILGIHILGSHATEVLHEAQLAKTLGIPFSKIQKVIHGYPSYSDAIRQPSKAHYVDRIQNNFFVKVLKRLFT